VKEIIIGIIGLTLLVFAMYQKPEIINPQEMIQDNRVYTHAKKSKADDPSLNPSTKSTNKSIRYIDPPGNQLKPKDITGNPHFDRLTPEVQQALKDSLLLEGPMEVIQQADGSIKLPSNGRVTQMPVAVQMPDGSIEVREYSNIPKTQ